MPTKTKKDWIVQLIAAAKEIKNNNPWALAWAGYDRLRCVYQGTMKDTGQEWYAAHKNDIYGLLDTLTVPDIDLKLFLNDLFLQLQKDGGEHLYVIPSSQLSDLIKYLISHPQFRGNLLDMDDESPWDEPKIDFENMCVIATTQFLNNEKIDVAFEYKDSDTGLVVHRISLCEKDFWYFVDEQQMKIADRRW